MNLESILLLNIEATVTCKLCLWDKEYITSLECSAGIPNPEHTNVIEEEDIQPITRVSKEQWKYSMVGRIWYIKGQEDHKKMYCRGTRFVNHAARYI